MNLDDVMNKWVEDGKPDMLSPEANNVTMFAGGSEMLKVAQDGFYVRGIKVKQDDKEAEIVYNAFKSFLMWAELNRT